MNILQQHVANIETERQARLQANTIVHAARFLMLSKGDNFKAEKLAENARALPNVQSMVRAAVAAGSTGGWGANLAEVDTAVSAFIESLKSFGAFDLAVQGGMMRVPIRTRIALTTIGLTAGTVAEGSAKIISKLTLSSVSISETKVAAIVVASDELLRNGALSAQLLGNEIRRAVAVQTDAAFLQKIASGITPSVASGSNATAILNDMEAALEAMTFASNAKIYAVTTPTIAKAIRTKATTAGEFAFPGALSGDPLGLVTLVASDGATAGTMVLFDASQLAGDPGIVELDSSNQATLQLDTVPTSPPDATVPYVSLFQNDLSAIRCERIFAVERPATTSVAVIQSIAY